MEAILGPLPQRFIRETRKTKYFWHNQLDWDPDSPDGRYVREHCRKLKVIYNKLYDMFMNATAICVQDTSSDCVAGTCFNLSLFLSLSLSLYSTI